MGNGKRRDDVRWQTPGSMFDFTTGNSTEQSLIHLRNSIVRSLKIYRLNCCAGPLVGWPEYSRMSSHSFYADQPKLLFGQDYCVIYLNLRRHPALFHPSAGLPGYETRLYGVARNCQARFRKVRLSNSIQWTRSNYSKSCEHHQRPRS